MVDIGRINRQFYDPLEVDRITVLGHFLRKTRLDELPQIINVIKGEMSLIGPRPERPEFVEKLENEIPYYSMRHVVKPGLTGWAQVMHPYANTVNDQREKLMYDLYYIKERNLLFVKGSVPGADGSDVVVTPSIKKGV